MTGPSAVRPGPVPVLTLGDVPLVSLRGEPHDGAAERLRHDIAGRIAAGPAPVGGIVIDISGVRIVDSFLGRVLAEFAASARLSAARTVLAGMRPAVALALVGLGLALPGPDTALDIERALSLLGRGPSVIPSAHPEEGA